MEKHLKGGVHMKRLLLSAALIFGVAASVAFSTRAVFSDTDSFNGNTIATATVEIEARPEASATTPLVKPITASGLVPAEWTDWYRGVIYNTSNSTNVRVYMYLDAVTGVACSGTNLTVTTGHAGSDASERATTIYNGSLAGLTGAANRRELTGYVFTSPNYLPTNTSLVVQQQAQLDPSADNSYQGTSCTWNEIFVAESI